MAEWTAVVTGKSCVLPLVCVAGLVVSFFSTKAIAIIGLVPILWFLAGKIAHHGLARKLRLSVRLRVAPNSALRTYSISRSSSASDGASDLSSRAHLKKRLLDPVAEDDGSIVPEAQESKM